MSIYEKQQKFHKHCFRGGLGLISRNRAPPCRTPCGVAAKICNLNCNVMLAHRIINTLSSSYLTLTFIRIISPPFPQPRRTAPFGSFGVHDSVHVTEQHNAPKTQDLWYTVVNMFYLIATLRREKQSFKIVWVDFSDHHAPKKLLAHFNQTSNDFYFYSVKVIKLSLLLLLLLAVSMWYKSW